MSFERAAARTGSQLAEILAWVHIGGPLARGPQLCCFPKYIYIYMSVLSLYAAMCPNPKMRPQAV